MIALQIPCRKWKTLFSTPSGLFNRINCYFFGTPTRARLFYPLGKAFRNVVLKLLGIRYIENLKRVEAPVIPKSHQDTHA